MRLLEAMEITSDCLGNRQYNTATDDGFTSWLQHVQAAEGRKGEGRPGSKVPGALEK